jgi:hypothetical protein
MTQFIEPNKKSDLTGPNALTWLQSLRTGLLEGLTVTKGSSGWLISLASGKFVLKGTNVYDDETRTDDTVLSASFTPGQNSHIVVYATYAYADVYPPTNVVYGVVIEQAAGIPAIPAQPADSVKLADIFIPGTATAITDADVKIVNAPKVPALGTDDADVLLERVVSSNYNLVVTGGGAFTYAPGPDILSWTEDLYLYAQAVTIQERYMSAPLAVGRIPAGSLTSMGDNAVAFVAFDRSAITDVGTPAVLVPKVLDLDDAATSDIADFFNAGTREQIVWLAMTVGGVLKRRAGFGNIFADEVVYDNATSGLAASDAQAAIDEVEGRVDAAESNISTNTTNIGSNDDDIEGLQNFQARGSGVYSGCTPSILNPTTVRITAGVLYDSFGRKQEPVQADIVVSTSADSEHIVYWDISTQTFKANIEYTSTFGDLLPGWSMPVAIVRADGAGNLTTIFDVRKSANDGDVGIAPRDGFVIPNHFPNLQQALRYISCFKVGQSSAPVPKKLYVTRDIANEPFNAGVSACVLFGGHGAGATRSDLLPLGDYQDGRQFAGLHVQGIGNDYSSGFLSGHRPRITWTGNGALFDFGDPSAYLHGGMTFENLEFRYNGAVDNSDWRRCVVRNAADARFVNCVFNGQSKASSIFTFDGDTTGADCDLGSQGVMVDNCLFAGTAPGGRPFWLHTDSLAMYGGGIHVRDSEFNVVSADNIMYIENLSSGEQGMRIEFSTCAFRGSFVDVISADAATAASFPVVLRDCLVKGTSVKIFDFNTVAGELRGLATGCSFAASISTQLDNGKFVSCRAIDGATIFTHPRRDTTLVDCDFMTDGHLGASPAPFLAVACKFALGVGSYFNDAGATVDDVVFADCHLKKTSLAGEADNNLFFAGDWAGHTIMLDNCVFEYANTLATPHTSAGFELTDTNLIMRGCRTAGARRVETSTVRGFIWMIGACSHLIMTGNELVEDMNLIYTDVTTAMDLVVVGNRFENAAVPAAGQSGMTFRSTGGIDIVGLFADNILQLEENGAPPTAGSVFIDSLGTGTEIFHFCNNMWQAPANFLTMPNGGGGTKVLVLTGNTLTVGTIDVGATNPLAALVAMNNFAPNCLLNHVETLKLLSTADQGGRYNIGSGVSWA